MRELGLEEIQRASLAILEEIDRICHILLKKQ